MFLLLFLFSLIVSVQSEYADFGTVPKGVNPTLYDASDDPIVQLDETTFNDTVFCNGREDCPSYVVEVSFSCIYENNLVFCIVRY